MRPSWAADSTAPTHQDTDWDRTLGLYDLLLSLSPNPAVALNRAVAAGERDGPAAVLAALDANRMTRSHL
jgi:RNA polymerase sigma-70 factor (ECF subfamily)